MEDFEWNVVNEGQLLDAMVGHKPVVSLYRFQIAKKSSVCQKPNLAHVISKRDDEKNKSQPPKGEVETQL
ncbi:hypothetical protein NQ317_011900 [Molorchus minor]|uniref:Uncharacterized protein n=1 Tax=Molorchus minor TaxID=1323400 RepID=A0ABQ9IS51_9CUCU|nr:hypothetical protein NQ317_011900 [Molorchus minor]